MAGFVDFLELICGVVLYVLVVFLAAHNGLVELERLSVAGFGEKSWSSEPNVPIYETSLWTKVQRYTDSNAEFYRYLLKSTDDDAWPWLSLLRTFRRQYDHPKGVIFFDRADANYSRKVRIPRSAFVYVHGGAMLWGSVDSTFFRAVATFNGCDICATCRYTLSNDGAEPIATTDLLELCEFISNRFSPLDRMVVCGYSSGAYLAFKMCLSLSGGPPGCLFSIHRNFPTLRKMRDRISYVLLAGFYRLSYHELNDCDVTSAFIDLTSFHLRDEKDRSGQDPLFALSRLDKVHARDIYVIDAVADSVTYQSAALLRCLRSLDNAFPVYYEIFPVSALEKPHESASLQLARASVTWLRRHSFPFIPRYEAGVLTLVSVVDFARFGRPLESSHRL